MRPGGFFAEDEAIEPPVQERRRQQAAQPSSFDEESLAALEEIERGEDVAKRPVNANPRPLTVGVCEACTKADGQPRFFEAFGLSVCYDCQRAARGPGGKYQVITKSKAKDEFLLTERQLAREHGGLGCMVQKNPHDSRYGDMKLYLRAQAEQLALAAWGSDEGLFNEKERRAGDRLQKAAARKRKASGEVALPRRKAASGAAPVRAAAPPHVHDFLPDETYNAASDEWTKRCASCGFELTYERF